MDMKKMGGKFVCVSFVYSRFPNSVWHPTKDVCWQNENTSSSQFVAIQNPEYWTAGPFQSQACPHKYTKPVMIVDDEKPLHVDHHVWLTGLIGWALVLLEIGVS